MKNLCKKESDTISKRQLFIQMLDILCEQGALREVEKNRMKVILAQTSEKDEVFHGTGSNL